MDIGRTLPIDKWNCILTQIKKILKFASWFSWQILNFLEKIPKISFCAVWLQARELKLFMNLFCKLNHLNCRNSLKNFFWFFWNCLEKMAKIRLNLSGYKLESWILPEGLCYDSQILKFWKFAVNSSGN
jgi:hypothetical protein